MALTSKLTVIADAIRSKTGKTDPMTLSDMAYEISTIQVGGGYDISKMYNVTINIPGRTNFEIYTRASGSTDFVEHVDMTGRNAEDYIPQPTNFMATSILVSTGNVTYLGMCNGLHLYIINGDGNILLTK